MLNSATIARPYAKAINQLSHEKDLSDWDRGLEVLRMILEHQAVKPYLNKMKDYGDIWGAFLIAVGGNLLLQELKNLILLLVGKRRLYLLSDIIHMVYQLRSEADKVVHLEVKTRVPLSDEQVQKYLKHFIELFEKKVEIKTEIDPNLTGGFYAKQGNFIVDGTLSAQLSKLEQEMSH